MTIQIIHIDSRIGYKSYIKEISWKSWKKVTHRNSFKKYIYRHKKKHTLVFRSKFHKSCLRFKRHNSKEEYIGRKHLPIMENIYLMFFLFLAKKFKQKGDSGKHCLKKTLFVGIIITYETIYYIKKKQKKTLSDDTFRENHGKLWIFPMHAWYAEENFLLHISVTLKWIFYITFFITLYIF